MKGKILRETFDKNLNEVIRLKQAEDGRSFFYCSAERNASRTYAVIRKTIICSYLRH